jgi:YggT family protein
MDLIILIFSIINAAIKVIAIATVVLMLLRLLITFADLNPFGWISLTLRRLTDPLVNPMKRVMINIGADPKYTPIVVILIVILLGYFALSISGDVLGIIAILIFAVQSGSLTVLIGGVLYALLSLYSLLILLRILFSWVTVSYSNRFMRFLVNVTDPLLVPLRRMIPPVGMFDISPIVAFFIIMLLQVAVKAVFLSGPRGGF